MAERALSFLLDSVILIDHFNGVRPATRFLLEHHRQSALSVITRAEVLTGLETQDAALAARVLDRFTTFTIDAAVADLAARLRREHRWKMPDALQAALARHHALQLVTRNVRDFPPEQFDFVLVPYTL